MKECFSFGLMIPLRIYPFWCIIMNRFIRPYGHLMYGIRVHHRLGGSLLHENEALVPVWPFPPHQRITARTGYMSGCHICCRPGVCQNQTSGRGQRIPPRNHALLWSLNLANSLENRPAKQPLANQALRPLKGDGLFFPFTQQVDEEADSNQLYDLIFPGDSARKYLHWKISTGCEKSIVKRIIWLTETRLMHFWLQHNLFILLRFPHWECRKV